MPELANALVIVIVAALVISRQVLARRLDADRRRWWLLPAILAVAALREPGILDAHHRAESAVLLGIELLIGLGTGAGWAWTTRIWMEPDGAVWAKSTKASLAVWIGGIVLRVGLFGVGILLGLHQDSSALLLALAGTLLVRAGILAWRAQSLNVSSARDTAYGAGMPRPAWKEPV